MKLSTSLFTLFLVGFLSQAQVGINTTTPDASAMLDIAATDKGILIPRITEIQKNAITAPATGLLIFQSDGADPGFYFYSGTNWDYLTANGAKEIDDLSDGSTVYGSIFLGDNVAASATNSSLSNVGIGEIALRHLTDGQFNVAVGPGASENVRTGNNNISIGLSAMSRNRTGNDNIAIGNYTGLNSDIATSGNIFIGNWAGYHEMSGGNKLYIENSNANANNALIYGEFDTDILRINGEVQVGNPTASGYALPANQGTSNQVLTTDGAGGTSWAAVPEVDGDITNEIQDLSVVGDEMQISGGGTSASIRALINPKFPDGFEGAQGVTHLFNGGSYTVPNGKNLYICNVFSNNSNTSILVNGRVMKYGYENYNNSQGLSNPIIAGPGEVVSCNGGSACAYATFNGLLVDQWATPITSGAATYTVPPGQILVLMGVSNASGYAVTISQNGQQLSYSLGNNTNSSNPGLYSAFQNPIFIDESQTVDFSNLASGGGWNGYLIPK